MKRARFKQNQLEFLSTRAGDDDCYNCLCLRRVYGNCFSSSLSCRVVVSSLTECHVVGYSLVFSFQGVGR